MPDERSGDTTTGLWQLQVSWSVIVAETFTTFKAAHERAVELVRDHEGAGGIVTGGIEHVGVSASYYSRTETPSS